MKKIKISKQLILIILSGIVIGFINGFFGGGGGMVCVPILERVLKIDNKKSHATAIAVILPLCILSSFIYIFKVGIDILDLTYVTLGVTAGGITGAYLLKKLNSKVVRAIFAILMLAGGVLMVLRNIFNF